MNIYCITFSPTGGARRVAERICASIGEHVINVDLCDRLPDAFSISPAAEDVCVVAIPSFAGRVPALAADRIRLLNGNGAKAVPVAVYGNRAYEDTLLEMKHLLTERGFRCIAASAAIAEHSMLRQYAAGRPDANDCAELDAFGQKIAEIVAAGQDPADLSVPGNFPYRSIGAFLKPVVTEDCMGCGVCADMCPAGAIPADHPCTTDLNACISCVRCVSLCPIKARRLDPAMLDAVNARIGPALSGRKENEFFF